MKRSKNDVLPANRKAYAALLAACRKLRFEPHDIAGQLDDRGRYDLLLDKEFPFHIRLFHFSSKRYTPTWNWHERLELTMALDGPARMKMGYQKVDLAPGDLLVVDNLKLHNMEEFPGFDTRVIVMTNFDQDEESRMAMQHNADAYLIKAEITPRKLLDIIAKLENKNPDAATA